jgi:hypothetical protein
MHHYNCKEWAPPPNSIAGPAPGEPAPELDDNVRPLSLPPLNLLASFRVWQDEENGNADVRPSLPPHRRVTKHIMSSCKSGAATKLLSAILLPKACVMYTSCISLNLSVRVGTDWRSWTSGDRNARTTEIVTVSGGHVLRETTSRGRCELVCPFDSPLPEDHRVNTLSTADSLRHH